jgi:hypothetical protein
MSIPLTGTNPAGLFNRLGKLGLLVADINTYQSTTLVNDVLGILNLFQGAAGNLSNAEPDIVGSLPGTDQASNQTSIAGITQQLTNYAQAAVIRMVFRDNPQPDNSLATALKEVIRQMKAASATVKACTVTATVNAAPSVTNNGNGVCLISTKRGDGLQQENLFAETENIVCTADSQGGGSAGNESFTFRGQVAQSNPFLQNWPLGSGAQATMQAINATANNSQGNLLVNSNFVTFTTPNIPDNWLLALGTAGTDFKQGSLGFIGTSSAQWVGGTGTNASITQTFALAAGTAGKLSPDTQYAVNFWAKVDVVPAAGVLTVDLVDGNGVTILDDQGVANSFTVTCSTLTTSFAAKNGIFRLPKALPAVMKVRLRLTTGLSGGSNLFVDTLGFGAMTPEYPGGPQLALFSGSANFLINDAFQIVTTNDRGGAANLKTFQTLADRFFNMKQLGLLLPSSGAPSISDGLIA